MKEKEAQRFFCDLIEKRYQSFFNHGYQHPFFQDLDAVRYKQHQIFFEEQKEKMKMVPLKKKKKNGTLPHFPPSPPPQFNLLSHDEIENLYHTIDHTIPESIEELDQLLHPLDQVYLPGTILPNQWNQFLSKCKQEQREKKCFFVLILGGGPMGLFTAGYLDYMRRRDYLPPDVNIQILLLDNRTSPVEGYREPFTRNRPFVFGTEYFSILLPKLYCNLQKHPKYDRYFRQMPIKDLENMFYLSCYHSKIPMFFTKEYESWESIASLMENIQIDSILDCTGGRFPIPMKSWMKRNEPMWYRGPMSNPYAELEWNNETNRYEFYRKILQSTQLPENTYYLSIDTQEDGHYYRNETYPIVDRETLLFFEHSVKVLGYMTIDQLEELIPWIPNLDLQKLLIYEVSYWKSQSSSRRKKIRISMSPFEMKMYYRPRVSYQISSPYPCIYVGMGDTNFSSHYILGAGLNRMIPIALYTLHLLPMLMQ